MATLQIKSVQLTEPLAGGPDEIVIVVVLPKGGGDTDFIVQQPRGRGEEYVKSLGVLEYRKISYDVQSVGGRKRAVPVDQVIKF